jgi:tellurite resistance protein TehA-like permease
MESQMKLILYRYLFVVTLHRNLFISEVSSNVNDFGCFVPVKVIAELILVSSDVSGHHPLAGVVFWLKFVFDDPIA